MTRTPDDSDEQWDEFDSAAAHVVAASSAAELFGARSDARRQEARAEFRRLARLCHPDHQPPDRRTLAEAAFGKLGRLWRDWQVTAAGGTPQTTELVVTTRHHQWVGNSRLGADELCDLYGATDHDRAGRAIVKVTRRPGDSDLVANEAAVLAALRTAVDRRWAPYFPTLIETVRHRDSSGERRINVVGQLDGFHTLTEVADAYPGGLDPLDAAWMWRRLLVALGAAHRAGVVHAAVVPDHVLIHPEEHGLVLVGWYYATTGTGQVVSAIIDRYRTWYPAEIVDRRPVTPATDIFLASRLMAHLIGPRLSGPLEAFIAGCTLPDQVRRPDDAWRLLAELDQLIEKLWGPRTFRPFHLPTRTWPTRT